MIADSCVLWPDTEDVMGFEFTDRGLEVVLSRSVPQLVRSRFAASVETVCERAGIAVADIDHYLLHPGGAKVLDAYLDVLPVDEAQLHWSREVLRTHGNMSAPTALFVLRSAMDTAACRTGHGPVAGDLALVSAMGPGFAAAADTRCLAHLGVGDRRSRRRAAISDRCRTGGADGQQRLIASKR